MKRSLAQFLSSAFAVCCLLMTQAAMAATPNLPQELIDKFNQEQAVQPGQLLLVDIYSPFCSVCGMMEPHLARIKSEAKDKLRFMRLDVSQPEYEKYLEYFDAKGTPAYILFTAEGKPIYKMSESISPLVLNKQILRQVDELENVALPAAMVPKSAENADIRLLAFGNDDCKPCKSADGFLTGYELADTNGLAVIRLDSEQKEVKAMLEDMKISSVPAYVITDEQSQELFRYEGTLESSARAKILWDIIRGFSDNGL